MPITKLHRSWVLSTLLSYSAICQVATSCVDNLAFLLFGDLDGWKQPRRGQRMQTRSPRLRVAHPTLCVTATTGGYAGYPSDSSRDIGLLYCFLSPLPRLLRNQRLSLFYPLSPRSCIAPVPPLPYHIHITPSHPGSRIVSYLPVTTHDPVLFPSSCVFQSDYCAEAAGAGSTASGYFGVIKALVSSLCTML